MHPFAVGRRLTGYCNGSRQPVYLIHVINPPPDFLSKECEAVKLVSRLGVNVQCFYFFTSPIRFTQKFQTGLNAGVIVETIDADDAT